MNIEAPKYPSTMSALSRGVTGRCPRCGRGRLLHRYLKVVTACPACNEAYGHFRADDAPPWLTIIIVAHIMVPIILTVEHFFDLNAGTELAIFLPLTLILTLILLPRCKGAVLALLWALKAAGSESESA